MFQGQMLLGRKAPVKLNNMFHSDFFLFLVGRWGGEGIVLFASKPKYFFSQIKQKKPNIFSMYWYWHLNQKQKTETIIDTVLGLQKSQGLFNDPKQSGSYSFMPLL